MAFESEEMVNSSSDIGSRLRRTFGIKVGYNQQYTELKVKDLSLSLLHLPSICRPCNVER